MKTERKKVRLNWDQSPRSLGYTSSALPSGCIPGVEQVEGPSYGLERVQVPAMGRGTHYSFSSSPSAYQSASTYVFSVDGVLRVLLLQTSCSVVIVLAWFLRPPITEVSMFVEGPAWGSVDWKNKLIKIKKKKIKILKHNNHFKAIFSAFLLEQPSILTLIVPNCRSFSCGKKSPCESNPCDISCPTTTPIAP